MQCMGPEPTSNGDNNCTDGQSNEIQPNVNVNRLKPTPKTSAERSRDYRARLRAARQENQNHNVSPPIPKKLARQNEIQHQNLDEITTLSGSNGNFHSHYTTFLNLYYYLTIYIYIQSLFKITFS